MCREPGGISLGTQHRLRGTLPTPDGQWTRHCISTPLPYQAGLEQARQLAEQLGRDLQLHRMGLEVFPLERWKAGVVAANKLGSPISGLEAILLNEKWWQAQRKRGPSAATTWAQDYTANTLMETDVLRTQLIGIVGFKSHMQSYLSPSEYIDLEVEEIRALAIHIVRGVNSELELVRHCFEFVRDEINHSSDFRLIPSPAGLPMFCNIRPDPATR